MRVVLKARFDGQIKSSAEIQVTQKGEFHNLDIQNTHSATIFDGILKIICQRDELEEVLGILDNKFGVKEKDFQVVCVSGFESDYNNSEICDCDSLPTTVLGYSVDIKNLGSRILVRGDDTKLPIGFAQEI